MGSSARRIDGAAQQREDLVARVRVVVAGRLVCEDDGRARDECARDRDALTLTTGKLIWPVLNTVAELNALESLDGPLPSFVCRDAGVDEWKLDVVQRRRAWEEIEGLKDEADLAVPDAGELVLILVGNESATQPVLAGCWSVEAADEIHQCRFSRPGRTHDRHVLVATDRDVDST